MTCIPSTTIIPPRNSSGKPTTRVGLCWPRPTKSTRDAQLKAEKGVSLPLHPSSMTLTQNRCDTKRTTRVNSRKTMLRRMSVLQTSSALASCPRQKASLPLVATFHMLQTPNCAMVELRREPTAAQVATQGACFNARPDLRRPPKKNAPGPLNPTGRSST